MNRIKVVDGGETRRLCLRPLTYANVLEKLGGGSGGLLRLLYEDTDGDMVTVASDEELVLALRATGGKMLKLYVQRQGTNSVRPIPALGRDESEGSDSAATSEAVLVNLPGAETPKSEAAASNVSDHRIFVEHFVGDEKKKEGEYKEANKMIVRQDEERYSYQSGKLTTETVFEEEPTTEEPLTVKPMTEEPTPEEPTTETAVSNHTSDSIPTLQEDDQTSEDKSDRKGEQSEPSKTHWKFDQEQKRKEGGSESEDHSTDSRAGSAFCHKCSKVVQEFEKKNENTERKHNVHHLNNSRTKNVSLTRDILRCKNASSEKEKCIDGKEEITTVHLKSLVKDFLKQPELAKALCENMHEILRLLAAGDAKSFLILVKNVVAEIPALANHPFPQTIDPQFDVLTKMVVGQMNSNWNAFLAFASVLLNIKTVEDDAVAYNSKDAPVYERKQGGKAEVNPGDSPQVTVKEKINEKPDKDDRKAEFENDGIPGKKKTEPSRDIERNLREQDETVEGDLIKVTGKGNCIKWSFNGEEIPSIKYCKFGWTPRLVKPGDRLVRINDTSAYGMTKLQVQGIWLQKKGGAPDSSLYFLPQTEIHPFERHHDKLATLVAMGFNDTTNNRKLLETHKGDCESVINILLKKK